MQLLSIVQDFARHHPVVMRIVIFVIASVSASSPWLFRCVAMIFRVKLLKEDGSESRSGAEDAEGGYEKTTGVFTLVGAPFAAQVGALERTLYILAVMLGRYELVVGWLVLKAFFGWRRKPKGTADPRTRLNVNLVLNILSVLLGLAFGLAANYVASRIGSSVAPQAGVLARTVPSAFAATPSNIESAALPFSALWHHLVPFAWQMPLAQTHVVVDSEVGVRDSVWTVRSAWAAFIAAGATVILAGVTANLAGVTGRMARATKTLADETKTLATETLAAMDQTDRQHQESLWPWCDLSNVHVSLHEVADDKFLVLDAEIVNVGCGPAVEVKLRLEMYGPIDTFEHAEVYFGLLYPSERTNLPSYTFAIPEDARDAVVDDMPYQLSIRWKTIFGTYGETNIRDPGDPSYTKPRITPPEVVYRAAPERRPRS